MGGGHSIFRGYWWLCRRDRPGGGYAKHLRLHAAKRGQGVFAPRVMTPDALLSSQMDATVASRLDSLLAWCAVFRDLHLDEFREVFPVDPPSAQFFLDSSRLAQEDSADCKRVWLEGGLRIADVVAKTAESFAERPRCSNSSANWNPVTTRGSSARG